ncbi:FAD-binding monooxygenase [Nocardia nova SH22a]|uniref:FAD-binding monooxygenase n=1 Tax=Nocardia nova SH22a TaxID=1415166 RepID=W5TGZ2_9NOCA|nr:FAD-dependent oxidoreductase [Nocardia nova]AHH18268.1 FAD-binding monooxygenase [Nocardia nova SH22a]
MTVSSRTDVLVVGAGPVGLAAAAALLDRGAEVMIADAQPTAADTSRAAVVHARTLEVLEQVKLTAELIDRGVRVERFTVRERDRVLLHIGFGELPCDYPFTLLVPQNVTEELLVRRLESLGGSVIRPCRVLALAQDGDGVTADLDSGQRVRARYVIGADGMHSTVREQAGIEFHGAAYPESFVLADAVLGGDVTDEEVRLYFASEGVSVLAPLPGGRHRMVATVADAPAHPDAYHVGLLLKERGPQANPITVQSLVWSSRFRVHHRLADRYRAGRILLAGDAAHVHSPAGGQGMNTGIQDALALADALGAVVVDGASDAVLDAYESARRPIAERVVSFTDTMTRVATVPAALRGVRNSALRVLDRIPAVHRRMALELSELANR